MNLKLVGVGLAVAAGLSATQAAASQQIELPVVVHGRERGGLPVELAEDGSQGVSAVGRERLVEVLKPLASDAVIERLQALSAWPKLGEVEAAGIGARLDEAALQLVVEIPPRLRRMQIQSLSGVAPSASARTHARARTIEKSPFGLYLNPAARLLGNGKGLSMEPRYSMGASGLGFAFEASGARGVERWTVTRDLETHAIRLRVGDLYVRAGARAFSLSGVGITKEFSIHPLQVFSSSGRTVLVLDRPARASVWVGENLIRRLELDPGTHELDDFPAVDGYQDSRVEITDDSGVTRTIDTSYVHASRLLKPGVSQWVMSTGRARGQWGEAVAWWRQGVLAGLTLGGGWSRQDVAGPWLEWTLGLRPGFWDGVWEPPSSARPGRARHSHELSLLGGRVLAGWAREEGRISRYMGAGFSLGPLGSASLRYASSGRQASLSRTWSGGLSTRISYLDESNSRAGQRELRLDLSFSPQPVPGSRRMRVAVHASSRESFRGVEWSPVPEVELGWETRAGSSEWSAEGEWSLNRGVARAAASGSRAVLSLSTGIGLTQGGLGWGRPVEDAFAVVTAARGSSREVVVNPGTDGAYEARGHGWLGALLPRVQPYRSTELRLRDSGTGEEELVQIKPGYREGVLVIMGDELPDGVRVQGVLEMPEGGAAALRVGLIRPVEASGAARDFFTDGEGAFVLDGVAPGSYQIELEGGFYSGGLSVGDQEAQWGRVRLSGPGEPRPAENSG